MLFILELFDIVFIESTAMIPRLFFLLLLIFSLAGKTTQTTYLNAETSEVEIQELTESKPTAKAEGHFHSDFIAEIPCLFLSHTSSFSLLFIAIRSSELSEYFSSALDRGPPILT
ncbi:MAG: hypothetical protein O9264_14780 [Leptospira sp.]|nr:hypothetical protein [Leptospira sp.]